jgi:hypothetical protein
MLYISLRYEGLISLFGLGIIFNLAIFAQYSFILYAQHQLGNRFWRFIPALLFFAAAGTGMMVNTLRAALEIFSKKRGTFERTPKFGITSSSQNWTRQKYQLKLDPIVIPEIIFGLLTAGTCLFSLRTGNWIIAAYSALFSIGLFFVAFVTIYQAVSVMFQQYKQNRHLSSYPITGSD